MSPVTGQKGVNLINNSRFIIIYFLLGITALYIIFHSDIAVPMNKPFSQFPTIVNSWRMTSQAEFSEDTLNVLRPTDYLSRQYAAQDGSVVNLYLGYHGGGKGSRGIHSPKHCLPGSGWNEVSSEKRSIDAGGKKINLVRAVYQKGESRELFLYWFQVGEKSLSDEYSLKLSEILNSVTNRRRDSTFVRVSFPIENDEKKAMDLCTQFIRDFFPVIQEYMPK